MDVSSTITRASVEIRYETSAPGVAGAVVVLVFAFLVAGR